MRSVPSSQLLHFCRGVMNSAFQQQALADTSLHDRTCATMALKMRSAREQLKYMARGGDLFKQLIVPCMTSSYTHEQAALKECTHAYVCVFFCVRVCRGAKGLRRVYACVRTRACHASACKGTSNRSDRQSAGGVQTVQIRWRAEKRSQKNTGQGQRTSWTTVRDRPRLHKNLKDWDSHWEMRSCCEIALQWICLRDVSSCKNHAYDSW